GVLEAGDQSPHRGVAVAPPAVGLGADHVHAVDHVPGHRSHQFSDGWGGAVANIARRPPWGRSTDTPSVPGPEVKTSSGAASSPNEPPESASPSSCPPDQPA